MDNGGGHQNFELCEKTWVKMEQIGEALPTKN